LSRAQVRGGVNVGAEQRNAAVRWAQRRLEETDRRALAGTIGAEQAGARADRNRERDLVQRRRARLAIALGDLLEDDGVDGR
jgi:hypothetical protein